MNYKRLIFAFLVLAVLLPTSLSLAQPSGLPVDVPREEVFIVDQILKQPVVDNHNFWVTGPHPVHRHALMMETLWIRDQETGERVYDVAISDPVYNDDYTEMSVELRDNIYWSDGVQFTADDLVFTVETLKATPDLNASGWSSNLNRFMDSVEKTGDFSVTFHLSESAPRFHTLFEARWNGIYMMPKHYAENIDDLPTATFEDAPVLGAYMSTEMDPNANWELLTRRDDWERSPAGVITGNPGPKYVLTIMYGDSARKAIAMSRGELDVYFDVDFEAFETTLDTTPTARSWYTEFPWAYPNEVSSRMLNFNFESETQPWFQNAEVRWALALALDIVELQTEYIGGVAKVTDMPVPTTPALMRIYHDPMEEWFQNIEIDLGDGQMYKPYDPTIPDQIAAWAEEQGYTVPGAPRDVFGSGWWKYDTDAAARLLEKNGFSRDDGGNWLTPDGDPWSFEIIAAVDEHDAFRIANAAADMWSDFGIDATAQGLERTLWTTSTATGQFDVSVPWASFVQASGDSWPEVNGMHPDNYLPIGEDIRTVGGGMLSASRNRDPQIGEFIDSMVPVNPDDPRNVEITSDFLKYWTENMYAISVISFKKFVTWDERYWTGFPTFESPSSQPLYWFQGGKVTFQNLTPVS